MPHYPTAARYNAMFGFRNDKDIGYDVENYNHPYVFRPEYQSPAYNTVCFHDEERYYDPKTGMHSIRHTNTGHWGPFCYPGCRALRSGKVGVWESPPSFGINADVVA